MEKRVILDPLAPTPPSGPYSPALAAGPFIFLSGQTGRDPASQELRTTIEDQTRQALDNMRRLLEQVGADLADVMTVTVFLARQEDRPGMNAAYREYFREPFPARATVVVAQLGQPETLIEMQAMAYRGAP